MNDQGKYLIMGGTSGIGLALTQQLMNEGHEVWTASRRPTGNPGAHHLVFDALRDDPSTLQLPEVLDGFAYCPGSINLKPFHRLSDAEFLEDFNLNVIGAIRTTRTLLPKLKGSAAASVVFFSTVAVQQGMPFHASIAAAKGAIEGLTRSLAAELAPAIRVNAVAPSLTDTPLAARLLTSDEKRKASGDRHPLKKIGTADDVAAAARFLLTPASGWMTGQIVAVDGGLSALRPM
ncbi:MAG: SDR family NAD(P)-dependent oxidoreductase [Cyclobacteriaceae bacterium]|jgi:3-oxoacyl-[acyl-carrier protein] reductase